MIGRDRSPLSPLLFLCRKHCLLTFRFRGRVPFPVRHREAVLTGLLSTIVRADGDATHCFFLPLPPPSMRVPAHSLRAAFSHRSRLPVACLALADQSRSIRKRVAGLTPTVAVVPN